MEQKASPIIPSEIYRFQIRNNIRFITKPSSVLQDYIALHWLVPKNEMRDFHHKIPKGQIWVRDDVWFSPKQNSLRRHELIELKNMIEKGFGYRKAHRIAEVLDGSF